MVRRKRNSVLMILHLMLVDIQYTDATCRANSYARRRSSTPIHFRESTMVVSSASPSKPRGLIRFNSS